MTNTFKCSYCLQEREIATQLGGEFRKNIDKLLLQKELYEKELAKITVSQLATSDPNQKKELEKVIAKTQNDLKYLYLQIENNKDNVCKPCLNKFKIQDIKTFNCGICKENITGKMYEDHVENYQDEGIEKRKLTKFCQSCKDNRVILATLYCPRKGEGRDGDWDITKPLFDCDCPVPVEKQII